MNRRSLLGRIGAALGLSVCPNIIAGEKSTELLISTYPFKQKLGDWTELLSVYLLADNVRCCESSPIHFNFLAETGGAKGLRNVMVSHSYRVSEAVKDLKSKSTGGDPFYLLNIRHFLKIDLDKFREVFPLKDRMGDTEIDDKGWDAKSKSYV